MGRMMTLSWMTRILRLARTKGVTVVTLTMTIVRTAICLTRRTIARSWTRTRVPARTGLILRQKLPKAMRTGLTQTLTTAKERVLETDTTSTPAPAQSTSPATIEIVTRSESASALVPATTRVLRRAND